MVKKKLLETPSSYPFEGRDDEEEEDGAAAEL